MAGAALETCLARAVGINAGTVRRGFQTSRARFFVLLITFSTFSHQPSLGSSQHLDSTVFQE